VTADRAVRWTAAAALVAVAVVAAYVSYWHAVEVVTGHAEPGIIGHLYPVLIDGIIVAASMVLLDAARNGERPPGLAWWMLGSGVVVTLAANVDYGARGGWEPALWAAWPAAAFVGCYETMMLLVRASARRAGAAGNQQGTRHAAPALIPAVPVVPAGLEHAAEIALRATAAAGNPYTVNALVRKFSLPRKQATELRQRVLASMNGHAPQDLEEPSATEGK
jgi:Protein of unknown function (DUF2637)